MQIANKEILTRYDGHDLLYQCLILGSSLRLEDGKYRVGVKDGNFQFVSLEEEREALLVFDLKRDFIRIRLLYTGKEHRKRGFATNLLSFLIYYANANDIAKIKVFSANDSFWRQVKDACPQVDWEISYSIDRRGMNALFGYERFLKDE